MIPAPHVELNEAPPRDGGGSHRLRRLLSRYGRGDAVVLVFVLAVTASIVYPTWGRGWLLLLDHAPGPNMSLRDEVYGLGSGVLSGAALHAALVAVADEWHAAVVGWLPFAICIGVAGWSMARVVGGPLAARLAGALLYMANPFVFERFFAGQLGLLTWYALLPFAVRAVVKGPRRPQGAARAALWLGLLSAAAIHFFWIAAVVIAAVVLVDRSGATVRWAVVTTALTLALSAYLVVPAVLDPPDVTVRLADSGSFGTTGDPVFGLFVNVAGLYGFWRAEPTLPKDVVAGWPVVLLALLTVVAAGARAGWRDPERRRLTAVLAVAGASSLLLALGAEGPAAPVYRYLFLNIPGFDVMREPQKFVGLLAAVYGTFFAFGVESIVATASVRRGALGAAIIGVALPLAYTPTIFGGLGGQVAPSRFPSSWYEVDRVMGEGAGRALVLPWHQYLSFPFTDGRIVSNPAGAFFRRPTIAGDNIELAGLRSTSKSRRSAYLEFLFDNGSRLRSFGRLVAPLSIEYIVLARSSDSSRYEWLDRQEDLEEALRTADVVVYRNRHPPAAGARFGDLPRLEDWGELVGAAEAGQLDPAVAVLSRDGPGAIRTPDEPVGDLSPVQPQAVRQRSRVEYEVVGGTPGYVALAEPFDSQWRLDGRGPLELGPGVTGFGGVGPTPQRARFATWRDIRLGALASLATAMALVGAVARAAHRRTRAEAYDSSDSAGSRGSWDGGVLRTGPGPP